MMKAMNIRKKYVVIFALLVAALLLLAFSFDAFLNQQSPDLAAYTAQADKLYKSAFDYVEKTRGVSLPQIPIVVITRAWAQKTWGGGGSSQDLQNIMRDENFYKGVFLMRENESLVQAQTNWAGSWVAVTWEDKIYVVREYFNPFVATSEATLIHELTHVMQGQLNLPSSPSSYDGVKARAALIEGDATFMADFYQNNNSAPAYTPMKAMIQQPSLLTTESSLVNVYPSIPDSISRMDYFAYDYGKQFVAALFAKGGWAAVNAAYANPPTTTAQVLDPDKYYANISAQPVASVSGPNKSWVQIRNDQYGEYFVLNMLSSWLPKNETITSVAGWRGDNFTYYEKGNEYLFTWNIAWRSAFDASNFSIAFQNVTSAAGSTKGLNGDWGANGRFLSISLDGENSTLIVCSNNEAAIEQVAPNLAN